MVICGEQPDFDSSFLADPEINRYVYLTHDLKWPRRGKRFLRWTRWLNFPFFFRKLYKLYKAENCDVIFVVYPDEYYLTGAWLLSRVVKDKFYVWYHNAYLENFHGTRKLYARWLQSKVFRDANITYTISAGLSNYMETNYPQRAFPVLPHFVTLSKWDNNSEKESIIIRSTRTTIRLLLLGSLNKSCLDAVVRICKTIKGTSKYQMDIYSGTPKWVFEKYGCLSPNVQLCDYLPEDNLRGLIKTYQIAILPLGLTGGLADIEYQTIFPTRAVDLICSGLPIIAHVPKDSYIADFLTLHDCAEIVTEPNSLSLLGALEKLSCDVSRCKQLSLNALAVAEKFDNVNLKNLLLNDFIIKK